MVMTSRRCFVLLAAEFAATRGRCVYPWAAVGRPRAVASRSLRRPRLIRQLLEHRAQHAGLRHALRERQPQAGAPALQVEPFRIAADATPFAVRRAEKLGRIEPAGVGMIGVHVLDHPGLGRNQRLGAGEIGEQILRLEIDDAAEARDQMRALELHLVEREVGEAREHLGFGLIGEIAPPRVRALGLRPPCPSASRARPAADRPPCARRASARRAHRRGCSWCARRAARSAAAACRRPASRR